MPPPPPPHPPSPPPTPPPLGAHRLPLPPSHPPPASLLLAPPSSPARALALLFPDSSAHLFPSLPSLSPVATSSPAPTTVRSPLAAAACFALLLPSSHLLFLSAHPSPASPAVHLRAYSLASVPAFPRFAPALLSFKRNASASGLPLQGLPFGLGVRLAAGVNAIALLSLAAGQIWVLAPKLAADGRTVELHKCAVIELEPARPVYAMEIAMGRLLLGESGGLRVFPLRGLMKGGKEREGKKESAVAAGKKCLSKKNGMVNGLVMPVRHREGDAVSTCKLTTLRVKQSSGSYCSFLLTSQNDDYKSQGDMESMKSVKVVSIHPLSKNKFLVLDSSGVLHVFSLPVTEIGSGAASKHYSGNIHTYRLNHPMKVQLSAVFSSSSIKTQMFWVSDGGHSVHVMSAVEIESPNCDNGDVTKERELATIKLSGCDSGDEYYSQLNLITNSKFSYRSNLYKRKSSGYCSYLQGFNPYPWSRQHVSVWNFLNLAVYHVSAWFKNLQVWMRFWLKTGKEMQSSRLPQQPPRVGRLCTYHAVLALLLYMHMQGLAKFLLM